MTTAATDTADAKEAPLARILNGTAHALIAFSVIAQTIRFALALKGQTALAEQHPILDFAISPIAIAPGAFLAFIKFLLNAIRSFRSPPARIKAALFLLITLWPVLLPLTFRGSLVEAMSKPPATAATSGISAANESLAREEHESEEFLKAYDWARERALTNLPECPRATESYRGCQKAVLKRREELSQAGSAWAEENRPAKASDCKGAPNFILGCRTYYFKHLEKPRPAGQGHYEGMTTAECQAEVNANFEVSEQLDLQNGNPQSAAVTLRRHWIPELADCENYDKLAESKMMPKAYDRLQQLLDRMKAGGTVTEEEKAGMLKDFSEMSKIRDQPYKTAYLEKADEYFARLSGEYKEPKQTYARISCDAYQAKISELAKLDSERAAAMRALKRNDGVVTNSARHSELNQQRIDMLWEWKYFTDGARAAGCETKMNFD